MSLRRRDAAAQLQQLKQALTAVLTGKELTDSQLTQADVQDLANTGTTLADVNLPTNAKVLETAATDKELRVLEGLLELKTKDVAGSNAEQVLKKQKHTLTAATNRNTPTTKDGQLTTDET